MAIADPKEDAFTEALDTKTFQILEQKIISPGLCRSCGGCSAVCIYDAIDFKEGLPYLATPNACDDCSYCLRVCLAQDGLWLNVAMQQLEEPQFFEARATMEALSSLVPGNGAQTTTLLNALQEKLVAAVRCVITEEGKPWAHKTINARTFDELLRGTMPKYSMIPSAASLDEIRMNQIAAAAMVGTPCQIEAARYIAHYRFHQLAPRIKYYVGTFCRESYNYYHLKKLIDERLGISIDRVATVDLTGELILIAKDGSSEKILMDALERALWSGCLYCQDLTARFSDVSFGWAVSPEWDAMIVRTEQGQQLVESAKENGLIEVRKMSEEGISFLTKLEEEKSQLGNKNPPIAKP
ncbi:MAG: Coenzyme F420 hydrogenase/dehydrogenase, beta subunit C-terminal domain [Candidatus Hodarchaeales archaeon]|jgi:coenzyme F420 hydrogenase subunit beta